MMQGAAGQLGKQLQAGLLITRHGYATDWQPHARIELMQSGHPVPDQHSLQAGARLVAFVQEAPRQAQLLFLISGGSSSLVEVLPDGMTQAQLQQVNDYLLSAGVGIAAMNAVRRRLSQIKGGRLALRLGGRRTTALYVSDVPTDDVAVIGSGLLAAESDPTPVPDGLPDWLQALLPLAPLLPDPAHPAFASISHAIVAQRRQALDAAAAAARAAGYAAYVHETFLDGDAEQTGRELVQQADTLPQGIHLWSAETTVMLPSRPGRGGRCQQLALAAAQTLAGADDLMLLAGATDGSDGNSDDAGALVDAGSLQRGTQDELEVAHCLTHADAGRFLAASGDLLSTGPTGSNVMDLVILGKFA
jgi:hydroxypyruvate reductase